MSHWFPYRFGVVACALCLTAGEGAGRSSFVPAATRQETISVSSNLVILPVRVTDSRGIFVSGLVEKDFRVYDDGEEQSISAFRPEDAPATVGMIVDHSRSMAESLAQVGAAVTFFAQSSNPQDEMFVVNFNDTASLEALGSKPFSSDPRELGKAVSSISARGRTALYDAVALGLRQLQMGRWQKKALIVVSDGEDNASRLKFPQLLALAQQSSAQIYCIAIQSRYEEANTATMERLARKTGAFFYAPETMQQVAQDIIEIAHDIRAEYTIGFTPQAAARPGSFRKLEVKVSAPGQGKLRVQTRAGYAQAPETRSSPYARSGS